MKELTDALGIEYQVFSMINWDLYTYLEVNLWSDKSIKQWHYYYNIYISHI